MKLFSCKDTKLGRELIFFNRLAQEGYAILNYGYSMLAGQVERTAVTRGLDVAVGSLHADSDGRPSLVYDLIEPLRPVLDAQVLGWAAGVRWRRADFVVTTEGKVRLSAGLARVVARIAGCYEVQDEAALSAEGGGKRARVFG